MSSNFFKERKDSASILHKSKKKLPIFVEFLFLVRLFLASIQLSERWWRPWNKIAPNEPTEPPDMRAFDPYFVVVFVNKPLIVRIVLWPYFFWKSSIFLLNLLQWLWIAVRYSVLFESFLYSDKSFQLPKVLLGLNQGPLQAIVQFDQIIYL